ncbi:MAG: hypothetical protein E7316_01785 [Clostridiales bacterium]|nr:hypothetical protein [Clostridiales bacterium]
MANKRRFRVVPFAGFRSAPAQQPEPHPEQTLPLPENAHPLLADMYRSMAALTGEMQKYASANSEYTRILAEKDASLSQQQQENEELSTLLALREEELTEAYEMIGQLETLCEETTAKYRRLSAYLLKLELELRNLNRSMAQEQRPQHLTASNARTTVDDLLAEVQQEKKEYVLEQRDNVIYRVKKKG